MTNTPKNDRSTRRPDCVTEIRIGNSVLVVSGYFKQDTTATAADTQSCKNSCSADPNCSSIRSAEIITTIILIKFEIKLTAVFFVLESSSFKTNEKSLLIKLIKNQAIEKIIPSLKISKTGLRISPLGAIISVPI